MLQQREKQRRTERRGVRSARGGWKPRKREIRRERRTREKRRFQAEGVDGGGLRKERKEGVK